MTIYNLYIFDKNGLLIYYVGWNRKKHTSMRMEEEGKLMYGMLYSIKSFVSKISPYDMKEGFLNYKTTKYMLNYFEAVSGVKIVMNTDVNAQNVRELLQDIYSKLYVEYIVKNPLCDLTKPITSELFKTKLDEFIKQNHNFNKKNI